MRTILKFIVAILLFGSIGGYFYWQHKKKAVIKSSIQDAINKKTDSLYYIHYDSSYIDEINGNASFYNVTLQSDSAQKEILKRTDSLPDALFNIRIDEVKAEGIDVAGLLQSQNVASKKIVLNKPNIHIINTGNDTAKLYSSKDTLELYQKILGKFESIRADIIQINNGTVLITNIAGKPLATFENINITLNNFLVDKKHSYQSVISYFIKDVRATIENIQLISLKNNTSINIEHLDYNAINKTLSIEGIKQYKINNFNPIIDLKKILLTGLSTDSFILAQQLRATSVNCDGGLITINRVEKKSENKNTSVLFTSSLIDGMQVGSAKLGKTNIVIINQSEPNKTPFVLNDVEFDLTKSLKVSDQGTVNDLINNAQWKLRSSGFTIFTNDKLYKFSATGINIDNTNSFIKIKKIILLPQLSEAAFMKQRSIQGDRYDFVFNDIELQQVDFKKLLNENKIEVQQATLQPILKIFNDRLLPYDMQSKVGKYPHQSLQKLATLVYINQLKINNGNIVYKERGRESETTGSVNFNNINASISNLTNIQERITQNAECRVIASTLFLGTGKLSTEWRLPLSITDSTFTVTGRLQQMDAKQLNKVSVPLGMTFIKKGLINDLTFNFTGTNYSSKGEVVFLYKDLNIKVLKKNKEDELVDKDLTSFIANLIVKNSNPQNGVVRSGAIDFKRDISKSFFNFLWKSVLNGAKKTASGKK